MKAVLTPDTVKNRVIRVFISSTFHDMKDEREYLVKNIFPQLRSMCEKRGVTWSAIDLRWGITNEQQAEGRVLPICLREIDECKPFFIGMLGERYGSVPDEIPEELVKLESWLDGHRDRSVCELEILHGALNDPGTAEHAHFYLRDPAYVNTVPVDRRAELIEAPTPEEIEQFGEAEAEDRAKQRREKLIDLKERIRQSGLPVRESYENPKHLGELVLEDVRKVIDNLFPEDEKFDPLDQEAAEHDAFARSRFRVYIGRDEYFDRLDEHVQSDSQPLVVLGESGSGKSALLANWAENYRRKNPNDLFISHFIGATPYSADWAAMLRRIMGEFKRRFDIQGDIPGEPDKLRSAFANWLHMASAGAAKEGIKIILILDALNQLEDRDQAPDLVWLPPFIPENIRLILSTLPGRPLDDVKKRELPTIVIKPLDDDERKQVIRDYLMQYRKTLSDPRIDKIASSHQTRNPLFLTALLEELRLFGEHDLLDKRIEYYLTAETVDVLYEKILERYEEDYGTERPGLVRDVMTLLWASRRGLSAAELLDLLGQDGEPLPAAVFSHLYLAAEHSLVSRSGLIGFFHDYLRQAVEDRYLPGDEKKKAARLRLADYFDGQELSPRKVDELPWQLSEASDWQRLYDLLGDLEFFHEAWEKDEYEVKAYWAKTENSSDLQLLDAYQHVLDAPEAIPDNETITDVSWLLGHTGHPSEAMILREFLTEFYRKTGDEHELARSLDNQGLILRDRGDLDSAMKLLKESAQIFHEHGNTIGFSRNLNNQGEILRLQGDLDGAMKLHKEHERNCRELGDKAGISISLGNQGEILEHRGDYNGALKLFKEYEKTCRELGDKNRLSMSLFNQGGALKELGELDKAMNILKESESIARELGIPDQIVDSLTHQAEALLKKGEPENALPLAEEANEIATKHEFAEQIKTSKAILDKIRAELGKG